MLALSRILQTAGEEVMVAGEGGEKERERERNTIIRVFRNLLILD